MVWVTFTDDYNWRASKRGFVQYRKGQRINVPRRCAEEAEAAGKGIPERKAPVDEAPETGDQGSETDATAG